MTKRNDSPALLLLSIWLFLVLPLVRLNTTIDPGLALRFLLTGVVLSLVFLYFLVKPPGVIYFSKRFLQFLLILLLILLWMAVSSFQSINKGDALWELSRIAFLYLFFLTLYIIIPRQQSLIIILGRFCLTAIFIFSVFGLIQLIPIWQESNRSGLPMKIDLTLSSSLGNKNFFSEVLVMLLPLLVISGYREKAKWRILFYTGIACTLAWILLLRSTSSWLALIFASVVVLIFTGLIRKRQNIVGNRSQKKILVYALLIALIISSVFVFSGKTYVSLVKSKVSVATQYFHHPELIDSTTGYNDNSVFERILMWRNSIRMFHDHPVFGAGLNNWKLLQPQYGIGGTPFINTGMVHFEHPHNDFLLILAEQGPIGLVLYIIFFIFLLLTIRKSILKSEERERRIILICLGFGLLSFMVMSFFAYPRSRFYVMLVLMLYAALVLIFSSQKEIRVVISRRMGILFSISCFIIAAAGSAAAWYRLQGEIHTQEILRSQFSKNYARMVREAEKAESFYYPLDHTGTPMAWYKGMAHFYSGNFQKAVIYYEEAVKINPYHLRVLNDLATSYEKTGRYDKAIEMYMKALKAAPFFSESLLNLSATFYNTGQIDSALMVINKVQRIKLSYRDDKNYHEFFKAILIAKARNHFNALYPKVEADEILKSMLKREDLVLIYHKSDLNLATFYNEIYQIHVGSRNRIL